MTISAREFERLVHEGLEIIPDELREYIDNVQIVVEEEPSAELLEEFDLPPSEPLYGLYTGVPLTERASAGEELPDRIIIFRRPLMEQFDDPLDLRREVARTVIHEVAHHFGIDEDRLIELGWD